MAKQLVVDPKKCVSCRTCELVCSFRHNEEFNPRLSNVTVFHYEEAAITVPIMCLQCDEASCAAICPTGAISVVDPDEVPDKKKLAADKLKAAVEEVCA